MRGRVASRLQPGGTLPRVVVEEGVSPKGPSECLQW